MHIPSPIDGRSVAWEGELAAQLGDRAQLTAVTQNVGLLYKNRTEAADSPARSAAWLRRAVASVEESLKIRPELNNLTFTAESYGQLGILYRMLGELDQAEEYLGQALRIYEESDHPNLHVIYGNLAQVVRARGDAAAAGGGLASRYPCHGPGPTGGPAPVSGGHRRVLARRRRRGRPAPRAPRPAGGGGGGAAGARRGAATTLRDWEIAAS